LPYIKNIVIKPVSFIIYLMKNHMKCLKHVTAFALIAVIYLYLAGQETRERIYNKAVSFFVVPFGVNLHICPAGYMGF
jgi:hypothetical protein